MHENDMQMTVCIVELGVVSSIYGFSGRRRDGDACTQNLTLNGFYKGILHRFWRTDGFINLKTFVRMQNLGAHVHF